MKRHQFTIHRRADLLQSLGLVDLPSVRNWPGKPIKLQRGRRDVCRLQPSGQTEVLYLKRNLKPYRKHALMAVIRYGRLISSAQMEAEALKRLDGAGLPTSPCIASGAEFNLLGETFSFLITEAARGVCLDDWLAQSPSQIQLNRVSVRLAGQLRQVHDAGIGLPTLMGRHLFVDFAHDGQLQLTMIDVDRLIHRRWMMRQRVRDLAQLHFSIPLTRLSLSQRLRLLRDYARGDEKLFRHLLSAIVQRTNYLLLRRRRRALEFLVGLADQKIDQIIRRARQQQRWRWMIIRLSQIWR